VLDGLLVVDKPAGFTSHDVVAKLRRAAGQRRVGHAGTLDPDATGVLLVGLGRATRLLRFLQETAKSYDGRVVFGIATTTLDAAGDVVDQAPMTVTEDEVAAATQRFVGEINQIPPMVSAVQVGGRRLHEIARAGEEVERPVRRVRVDRFDVVSFEPGAYPEAAIEVECGSGTYVRSLAADLGSALGGCAHLGSLRRTRVGSFTLVEARPLDEIESDVEAVLLSPREAMRDLERVDVDTERARAVTHGMPFPATAFAEGELGGGPFAVVDPSGDLLAVYERSGGALKPAVVMATNE
jgi:tRNA pseudouridine55 synthase